jgi:general secretion pathway protein M
MRLHLDRRFALPAALAAAFVICIVLVIMSASLRKERDGLRTQQKEMSALRDEYLLLKGSVGAVEGRQSLTRVAGVVQGVEEVFKSLGLAQKVKSVKSAGARDQRFGTEEEAEVVVEKVNMNELVNILYKLENAPLAMTLKKTVMRTTFENPALLNLTLTVGLIRPK